MSTRSCPLCGGTRLRPVGTVIAGTVSACRDCGIGWVGEQASFEDEVYDADFFGVFDDAAYLSARLALFDRHLEALDRLRPSRGRLLDVGAALGDFVARARADRWDAIGLEPSTYAAAAAATRGVQVLNDTLDSEALGAGSFDAVHLSHVLEHVPDPRSTLTRCHELLMPGGVLALEVPNELTNLFKRTRAVLHRSTEVDQLTPEHVWFFTPRSLSRVVQQAGFSVELLRTANVTPLASEVILGGVVKHLIDAMSRRTDTGEVVELYALRRD